MGENIGKNRRTYGIIWENMGKYRENHGKTWEDTRKIWDFWFKCVWSGLFDFSNHSRGSFGCPLH
jgi:hypothetical protein